MAMMLNPSNTSTKLRGTRSVLFCQFIYYVFKEWVNNCDFSQYGLINTSMNLCYLSILEVKRNLH